jgi:predicted lysophospholipase L1 biosynthesis ABC-type transport system permease subunit
MNTVNTTYRYAIGLALTAGLLLVWLSLGVGIIGRDGDPANVMYFGVLAVGLVGALFARFRPLGMARALVATALAQASVAAIAMITGLGYPYSGPIELALLNGFFVALFVGSAWLFHRAAHARLNRSEA